MRWTSMPEHAEEVEQELDGMLVKLEGGRREIEDKAEITTMDRFSEILDDLDEDLGAMADRLRELCEDASDSACEYYDGLRERLTATREEVRSHRRELTGGVGEDAMVEAIDAFHARVDEMTRDTKRWSGKL